MTCRRKQIWAISLITFLSGIMFGLRHRLRSCFSLPFSSLLWAVWILEAEAPIADVDVEVEADVDVDTDVDADVNVDSSSGGSSFTAGVLGILNVGKVPFTILLMALFATWGISGLIVNEFLNINVDSPHYTLWISVGAALLCSIFGTRYLALGLSKLFPENDRATNDSHLIGLRGRVISGRVTTTFGTARVPVPQGPELTVSCRIREARIFP